MLICGIIILVNSPESPLLIAQRNIHFWPDQHPEVQDIVMSYADTMANDPRTEREVEIVDASVSGYYPPEFRAILGSTQPHHVDMQYSYSPVEDHYSPVADLHDFYLRLHGDVRTGEVIDIVPSSGSYRKSHIDNRPFGPTQSESMNVVEPEELKNLLVSLLRYDKVIPNDILDYPLESLLKAVRRAGNALVSSAVHASETMTAVHTPDDKGDSSAHILVRKRTWRQFDSEPTDKNVYAIEVATTTPEYPVPRIGIPLTRTLQYRFSESSRSNGRNPNVSVKLSIPNSGEKNREFADRWLAGLLERETNYFMSNPSFAIGHLMRAVVEMEQSSQPKNEVA